MPGCWEDWVSTGRFKFGLCRRYFISYFKIGCCRVFAVTFSPARWRPHDDYRRRWFHIRCDYDSTLFIIDIAAGLNSRQTFSLFAGSICTRHRLVIGGDDAARYRWAQCRRKRHLPLPLRAPLIRFLFSLTPAARHLSLAGYKARCLLRADIFKELSLYHLNIIWHWELAAVKLNLQGPRYIWHNHRRSRCKPAWILILLVIRIIIIICWHLWIYIYLIFIAHSRHSDTQPSSSSPWWYALMRHFPFTRKCKSGVLRRAGRLPFPAYAV